MQSFIIASLSEWAADVMYRISENIAIVALR